MESNTGKVFNMVSLYSRFQEMQDTRKNRGKRYALATILIGMFLAKLCGEDKPSGIAEWVKLREKWLTGMLGLKRRHMPNHNTHRRILADVIDKDEFEELAREHFKHSGETGYQVVVSVDGKMVRGTIDDGSQNEISAAPPIMEVSRPDREEPPK